MSFFFSILVASLAVDLPAFMTHALVSSGIPSAVAAKVAQLPPTAALFAAFLGYNPMRSLIPGNVLSHLSTANRANLLSTGFFPHAIAPAFVAGLHNAFYLAVGLSAAAAVFSFLRGPRYIHELDGQRRSEDDEEES